MSILVLPYDQRSKSAGVIAKELGVKRILRKSDKPLSAEVVVNWGCSRRNLPARDLKVGRWINHPDAVSRCVDKRQTYDILYDYYVSTLNFTLSKKQAILWAAQGSVVFCRTKVDGHSGAGIVVARGGEEVVDAPLYTVGVMDGEEYRIHVVDGKVIDQRQKKRKKDFPDDQRNPDVKSHRYGYVFAMKDLDVPEEVDAQAIKAVKALGLDFAAVDMIYKDGEAYVVEVNTSCGLSGSTPEKYGVAIKELIGKGGV